MLKKKALSRSRSLTLPDERYRAVVQAERFLSRLAGGHYARVPKAVREEASSLLRHYPGDWDLKQLERAAPHVVQERMEPLHRMVAEYSQSDIEFTEKARDTGPIA